MKLEKEEIPIQPRATATYMFEEEEMRNLLLDLNSQSKDFRNTTKNIIDMMETQLARFDAGRTFKEIRRID